MTAGPASVTSEVDLRLVVPGSPALRVRARLRYDVRDPYAVMVRFHTGNGRVVEWPFARQPLPDGVPRPAGEGDVRVWPLSSRDGQTVCLALSSPSGHALFEASLADIVEFLTESYVAVPTGAEGAFIDIDGELAALLADGAG